MEAKKKIWGKSLLALVVVIALMLPIAAAQDKTEQPKAKGVYEATVEGTNFCIGCTLKKREGAIAQCKIFGHRHALRVAKAVDKNGKELPEVKGWVLHYLDTEKSQDVLKAHHGEKLTIKGKIYPQERVLEVDSFKETKQEAKKAASAEIQQTVCPIMGGKINKSVFTEYKGKKVYFCCAGCKPTFEKNPEKYIAKLPQFKD
jgi:YHS domain-containing protein